MSLLEHPVTLERFDYTRVGEHGALLRVLTRLSGEPGEPSEAELRVGRSQRPWQSFVARGCRLESAVRDSDELVWRGLFAVPFALVEQPQFSFELAVTGLPSLRLPRPVLRGAFTLVTSPATGSPELDVTETGELTPDQVARLTGGRLRTGAVALATALAVTASATPALADVGFASSASHAQITRQRIERLASFAVKRAREEAARKKAQAARAARSQTSTSRPRPAHAHSGLTGRLVPTAGSTPLRGSSQQIHRPPSSGGLKQTTTPRSPATPTPAPAPTSGADVPPAPTPSGPQRHSGPNVRSGPNVLTPPTSTTPTPPVAAAAWARAAPRAHRHHEPAPRPRPRPRCRPLRPLWSLGRMRSQPPIPGFRPRSRARPMVAAQFVRQAQGRGARPSSPARARTAAARRAWFHPRPVSSAPTPGPARSPPTRR